MKTVTITISLQVGERGSKVVELNDEALETVYAGQIGDAAMPLQTSPAPIQPLINIGSVVPSIVFPGISL
jgi:hypothetical protein